MGHLIEEYQVNEALLPRYYHLVSNLIDSFVKVNLECVSTRENMGVYVLSKLASIKEEGAEHDGDDDLEVTMVVRRTSNDKADQPSGRSSRPTNHQVDLDLPSRPTTRPINHQAEPLGRSITRPTYQADQSPGRSSRLTFQANHSG
ncbi:hypothetical protein V8G54_027709 [Vigna mungo]|uniref:Uncharacterized protein n=1 Tax=Vigna mungo TaxID=3915 RepID=A0AAQ3N352_VIGMU